MVKFDKIIEKLNNEILYAKENFVPIIRKESSKFLYDYVNKNQFKNILEIGTAIGFSGSIMLSASDCFLTTIDKNENLLKVAKETFERCGYSNRVNILCGDAKVVLEDLCRDKNLKFDMIFLDGAKGQYITYLPNLVKLLSDNGVIFADNVLLGGLVESNEFITHKKRAMVNHLREYLEVINKSPFETELIRIEDGIAITKYKGEL